MIREVEEEISVKPTKYKKVGLLEFDEYYKGNKEHLVLHLYITTEWIGEPTESEEMLPKWFKIDEIPYENMFDDDRYWLPFILDGKKIKAYFEFDQEWILLSKKIIETEELL